MVNNKYSFTEPALGLYNQPAALRKPLYPGYELELPISGPHPQGIVFHCSGLNLMEKKYLNLKWWF